MEALRFRAKVDPTPSTYPEVQEKLNHEAFSERLVVPFEGHYQYIAREGRAPGPKFPFVIGMDAQQFSALEKGVIEGMFISPGYINPDDKIGKRDYSDLTHYFVKGAIDSNSVMFEAMRCLDSFEKDKGLLEFASNIAFIHRDLVEHARRNMSRLIYMGSIDAFAESKKGISAVYSGLLGVHFYNRGDGAKRGIFTMSRHAEPSHS